VCYGRSSALWPEYGKRLERLIDDHGLKRVCDVGGGANPVLPLEFVQSRGLHYTVLDISQEELDKAPAQYSKLRVDILAEELPNVGSFDLVFTKMLAEHVPSGERLHANIFRLLRPGGYAVHFFPTLYALPFVINRLIPERLASKILDVIAPRDRHQHDKFPAYYSWCRGPTKAMIRRLTGIGYEIIEYQGLFGHGYYKRIPLLRPLHERAVRYLLKHPIPQLTCYAFVVLRKPEGA
jgi:SAM-dependent methyltransferase